MKTVLLLTIAFLAGAPATAQVSTDAVVELVFRRVERRGDDDAWLPAAAGIPLRQGHALRTARRSSASVQLGTSVDVRLAEATSFSLREGRGQRAALELAEGELDVSAGPGQDFDLLLGATRVRPQGNDTATVARGRRARGGVAQVMAYRGVVEVETPGGRMSVPEGTGTWARRYDAPGRPEVLLPAAAVIAPRDAEGLDHSNPTFRWRAVDGAESYVVEVCGDERCGAVVESGQTPATTWGVHRLPLGRYYWRVTPVAASGLDGYPTRPVPFEVKALWRRPPVETR